MEDSRRGCGYVQNDGVYSFITDQQGFRVYTPPAQITGANDTQHRAAMKTTIGIIQKTMEEKKPVALDSIINKNVAPATTNIKSATIPVNDTAGIRRKTSIQIGLPKKTTKNHSHAVNYIPSRNTLQLGHIHTNEQPIKLKLHESYLHNIETQNLLQKNKTPDKDTVFIQITRSKEHLIPGAEYKPELSPSGTVWDPKTGKRTGKPGLLDDWKQGLIKWDQYTARFKREIRNNPQSQQALNEIYILSQKQPVTLLCYENTSKPNTHCHRHIIMDMLKERMMKENTTVLYEKNPDAYICQLEKDLGDTALFQTINQTMGKDAAHWVMGKTWNNTSNIPTGPAERGGISRNTEQSMLRGLRTKIWMHTNQNYGVQGLSHDDFVEAMLRGYIKPQKPGMWMNTLQKKDYPLPDYYKQAGELKNIIQLHTTPEGQIKYYDIPQQQRLLAARLSLIEHTKKDGWVNTSKNYLRNQKNLFHSHHKEFTVEESLRIDQKTRNILNQATQIFRIKQNTKIVLRTPRDILYKMRQIENCRETIHIIKKTIINPESRIKYIHEMQQKIRGFRLTPEEQKMVEEYQGNRAVLQEFYDQLKKGQGTDIRRQNIQDQGMHYIAFYEKHITPEGKTGWREYKRLPGEQINVEGRKMQYMLKNSTGKTTIVSWGRLWHMQQKYPNMPFLKKHPDIQQDLNKYQKTPPHRTHPDILFEKENHSRYCPTCDQTMHDRISIGGNQYAHETYYNKKTETYHCMACGTDIGTKTLNEHEIYMFQQKHHQGPGTEPTISAPSKQKTMYVPPPPTPTMKAASKKYGDLYEDVFSQIGR